MVQVVYTQRYYLSNIRFVSNGWTATNSVSILGSITGVMIVGHLSLFHGDRYVTVIGVYVVVP